MKDGFVKIGTAVPSLKVADCTYNAEQIVKLTTKAAEQGTLVLTFPELCVTGYSCADLFTHEALIKAAESALVKIISQTSALDTLIFVGLPVRVQGKIYNCAAAIFKGKLLALIPKKVLPNYSEFSEVRHFTPAPSATVDISFAGQVCPFGNKVIFNHSFLPELAVAAEICEDVWSQTPPSVAHCMAGATLIVNLSASPESIGKPELRRNLVTAHAARNICAYVYANCGSYESTTDAVFSGHSFICENSKVLAENLPFENKELVLADIDVKRIDSARVTQNNFVSEINPEYRYIPFDTPMVKTELTRSFTKRPFVPEDTAQREKRCSFILDMQATALAKRLRHTNAKTAVIGVSGGLDSTLAIIAAVHSMKLLGRPASDILAITMPCFGTGKRTRTNAEVLCERLGVSFDCVDIADAVKQHLADIGHDETTYDVTYENAQARERTQVLMDIANKQGGLVIGTGDLSEAALGWCTYNGDHMSMYGVNCDVPKTLIRYIVKYYADICGDEVLKNVLYDILDTPISPELVPSKAGEMSQRTEDIIGDYDLHDFFLYYFFRFGFTPEKILRIAYATFDGVFTAEHIKKTLETFIKRFFTQQFKRSCTPDGVKVGSVALSPRGALKMPSDASYAEWIKQL